jgi:hypothetical protein
MSELWAEMCDTCGYTIDGCQCKKKKKEKDSEIKEDELSLEYDENQDLR